MSYRKEPLWWIVDGKCACPAGEECVSPGKHPLTRNGIKDATDDPGQQSDWQEEFPLANWGTATGDGFIVIDLDLKADKNGLQTIKALAKPYGGLPRTATVRTGSGGLHLFFKTAEKIRNSSGKLGQGIDVRGVNGYVVSPPSMHISGNRYEWIDQREFADLPEWLAIRLRPRETVVPAVSQISDSEVITAARDALDRHGIAVEGQGGDLCTFQAAAILVNDFALDEETAFSLLSEWNQECQPPWSEADLRAKLRGGQKYATRPRGCLLPFNVFNACKAELITWRDQGGSDPGTFHQCMDRVRAHVAKSTDPVIPALVEKEITILTGLKHRDLGLPRGRLPVEVQRGDILVTTELHSVADEAITTLARDIYQRAGVLCEVVTTAKNTYIHDLEAARIQDLMSSRARYVRPDETHGQVAMAPPERVATILASRREHKPIRHLDSITTAPIFLSDGSILLEKGYNPLARVYLEPSVQVSVPENPTREDALAALETLFDLVCDFKFFSEADRTSWLAGLLTPLVKSATDNAPAPLFCVSASSAGAGKTMLADLICRIITGQAAEARSYATKDPGEWLKKLTSYVKAASPVSIFDNVDGPVGDEALNRLITSATWSDRILGASEAPPLPNVSTWFCNGNNVEPIQDAVRRCLMIRITVDTERPQERTGFKRANLLDYAEEHRAEYLSAALTVLRAYHCAGRPAQKIQPWGSFNRWSSLVRGALVWAGCADPFHTQKRLQADLNEPEQAVHDFWIQMVERSDSSPGDIAAQANQNDARSVLGAREELNAHRLRYFLNRYVDKPRRGKRIRREGLKYWVEAL